MADEIKYSITGASELSYLLNQLPDAVAGKLRTPALRAGGNFLADYMKIYVRKATGRTEHSITVRSVASTVMTAAGPRSISTGRVAVVIIKPPGSLVHLLEFGSAHERPRPFIRPVVETFGGGAIRMILQNLATGIMRETSRIAGTLKSRKKA